MLDPRLAANLAFWEERVPIHRRSAFYDVDGFRAGRGVLEPFEVAELGDVRGRSLVHLQCHIGLDTLSWARRGALVTGVDFSPAAIAVARELALEVASGADFVCSEVSAAPAALAGPYQIVYTGKGALTWLPDLERWADAVVALLAPGGVFYLSEFHPLVDMLDDSGRALRHDYFGSGPIVTDEPGTYADRDAPTVHNRQYEWTHPLSRVISVLLDRGLELELLHEHPFTLFPRFPWLEGRPDGTYWPPPGAPSMPFMYSVRARRPGGDG
ncbi:MAG TPA: class I SAM-dependent methyltransferase [Candidatus Micrarchaeia archaeon]|nr:class I SAM-dependent methyltransferase [Candidatus Micrarchaeia archaeon]